MQYIKVPASSCVLPFTRPSIPGLLDTVRVLQREPFASSGQCIELGYIVNRYFIFVGDKKFPTKWIFLELVLFATSYTLTSNPQPHSFRVPSLIEESKHLLYSTWILKISIALHNTVPKKASRYWRQFDITGPNLFLLTMVISSNITVVLEMACS